MLVACSKRGAPCTDAELLPYLHNETWRLDLLGSYRTHIEQLMRMWSRCREQRKRLGHRAKPFRPIFKLSYCPNSATEMRSCTAEWGYNTQGYYLHVANQVRVSIAVCPGSHA